MAALRTIASGFLTGLVIGATLCSLVVGIIVESVPLFVAGLGIPLGYGILLYLGRLPRRAREKAVPPTTALARIDSLRAGGTETGDLPVSFILTVAPDGAPSHRVEATHTVNLVDLPDYRKGDVLVVSYPPDRPWKVRIVSSPPPEWQRRAANAVIPPAAESTLVHSPPEGCAAGVFTLVGLLLGAGAVLGLFRAELFAPEPSAAQPEPPAAVTSSGSATVDVGPRQSLLDEGELSRAVAGLARSTDVSQTLTAVVREHRLTVVFAPAGVQVPRFDLRTLPVHEIPRLVRKALQTLDVGTPQTWQVTVVPLPSARTIRVTVTGPHGSASLAG
ncbi:hypothetical protein G3I59_05240 [Amycolatopsis rubida]|uniref:DUF3592 domain-containing protein n=1 Tax=Amycolatopsis rubida TaxID=112413 RepID=A0ABX0BQB0_9PSEU|nr:MULTISPECIES: hypothetical protein [Amycolatopsis]MYW90038.1 hypothetical protein [Amycolatopsis rubida]NEC55015.1 hypothetical protein [Amycolatopsis rubida]OAP21116.1 hypothetical protein A4R44_08091 [Amycolatopsis sp. M39]